MTPDSTPSAPLATRMLPLLARALRTHQQITIAIVDNIDDFAAASGLPPAPSGYSGFTDLTNARVYLDATSDDDELRATITHELGHLVDPEATEEEVEMRTAELLIPLPEALHAHRTGDHAAVAERCHVDLTLVRTRIRGLIDTPTVRIPIQRGDREAVAG